MSVTTPAAASALLRGLLAGPARDAVVVGVFPSAVYVAELAGATVVAVESADALRLPCAVVVAQPRSTRPFGAVSVGMPATVGDGRVGAGPLSWHVARWWQPRVPHRWASGPRTDHADLADLADLPPLPGQLTDGVAALERALSDCDTDGVQRAAVALLGLGDGLTPAGDDVLAGMMVASHAADDSWRREFSAVVTAEARRRTTALSATLLGHAVGGHGIPPLLDVVDALGSDDSVTLPVARLIAVGHSSGLAMAHGVRTAVRVGARAGAPGSEVA